MPDSQKPSIEEKLKKLPTGPGVYLMKGASGEVLYVGKAKNLRSRVRSYFRKTGDGRYAVRYLASRTADIDTIVTANEKEALFLEDTLLKRHKPRYNIRLKDSKTYVSIKLTVKEKFPRILVTRQVKKDGSRYFGPYVSARAVRDTIKLLRRIFPLCTCSPSVFKSRTRPCLDFQLGICSAPAVGLISVEDYAELVDGAIMFLEGRNTDLLRRLKTKMKEAAAELDFERAASLRDQVEAIEGMLEEQKVVSATTAERDVVGMVRDHGVISVQVLMVREGRLVASTGYVFDDTGLPDGEIISSFLKQFYYGERFVPSEVLISGRPDDSAIVAEWLGEKRGRVVRLITPSRGEKLKLLKMAESNATEAIERRVSEAEKKAAHAEELARRLHLAKPPEVIEAFDISNIGGKMTVGAMVRFTGGEPEKDSYRLYRVRSVEGPDDYASMREVLTRRFALEGEGKGSRKKALTMPDLLLIDGGKGQLNIALAVLDELGVSGLAVAALAKDKPPVTNEKPRPGARKPTRGERVFMPNVKDPVLLREGSKPDLLLRRIRDEVHRFAITYHRKLRGKAMTSRLESVPGLGPKKTRALLDRFGDLGGVRGAEIDELSTVPGVTPELAAIIKETLAEDGNNGK